MAVKTQSFESWDDLRFFLAVARRGGLSGAARELGVNQSTVSRRVTHLEESLDARLFDREARGYALTATGERMLGLAAAIEDNVLTLTRTVQGADRQLRGLVRITTVDEVFERIAPHFATFRAQYPGIELEVNTDLRTLSLTRREADVAIRPGFKPKEDDIVGRKIVRLPLAAYASPQYLKSRARPRTPGELADHPMIGTPQRVAIHAPQARVVLSTHGVTTQAIAARAGLGIAVLPRFVGDPDPSLQRLFELELERPAHLWLLIHADLRQTARVRSFVDYLTEAIVAERELYEGSDASPAKPKARNAKGRGGKKQAR